MKTYLSADILTPAQFKLIGVDRVWFELQLQLAIGTFSEALKILSLHYYYMAKPGRYQVTQPDQIIEIMKTRDPAKGADSPYPVSLIADIENLYNLVATVQKEMEAHAERERKTKMAARDILDRVDKT